MEKEKEKRIYRLSSSLPRDYRMHYVATKGLALTLEEAAVTGTLAGKANHADRKRYAAQLEEEDMVVPEYYSNSRGGDHILIDKEACPRMMTVLDGWSMVYEKADGGIGNLVLYGWRSCSSCWAWAQARGYAPRNARLRYALRVSRRRRWSYAAATSGEFELL